MDWSSRDQLDCGCWFQGPGFWGFLDLEIKPTGLTGLHLSNEGLRDEQKNLSCFEVSPDVLGISHQDQHVCRTIWKPWIPILNVPRHRWSKAVGKRAQCSRFERRVHPARVKLQKWWKSQRGVWTKIALVCFLRKLVSKERCRYVIDKNSASVEGL